MLGVIDDMSKIMHSGFRNEGDSIFLIGSDRQELGGSEYLKQVHGLIAGKPPVLNLEEEIRLQKAILKLIKDGIINSAHDTSEGGIAICLAEKAIASADNLGAEVFLASQPSAGLLFGESQSRVIVSLNPEKEDLLKKICSEFNTGLSKIGIVTRNTFSIEGCIQASVAELRNIWENAIPDRMNRK